MKRKKRKEEMGIKKACSLETLSTPSPPEKILFPFQQYFIFSCLSFLLIFLHFTKIEKDAVAPWKLLIKF